MQNQRIIEALAELMNYCREEEVDFEEVKHLNRAVFLLGEEVYDTLKENGKTETEIELITTQIISGEYTPKTKEEVI